MSNQIEINNKIVKYLSEISNISDPIINELIKETLMNLIEYKVYLVENQNFYKKESLCQQ